EGGRGGRGGEMGGEGGAGAELRELGGCLVAFGLLARRHVDTRAGGDEAARDHPPDAARAPRHQRHLARHREEIRRTHPCAPIASALAFFLTAPVASSQARRTMK